MTVIFKPGQPLRVKPASEDDPVAIAMKGAIVRFMNVDHNGYVVVSVGEATNNKRAARVVFRREDLEAL